MSEEALIRQLAASGTSLPECDIAVLSSVIADEGLYR